MNHQLQYTPKALKDIEKILEFLSEIHHDLPRKFRNHLAEKLTELDEHPERWPIRSNDIRAIRLSLSKRLAYYAFYHYTEAEQKIHLLRIIPQQADPSQWPK